MRTGGKAQIPWQVWHFLRCVESGGSLARNIDFEVTNFEVQKKNRRQTSIFNLATDKIGQGLARNERFEAV